MRDEHGAEADVIPADLTTPEGLLSVETRLREDKRIHLLVNNAGAIGYRGFANPDLDEMDRIIRLNVTSTTRLVGAALPNFVGAENRAIINLSSVVALAPDIRFGVYGATKAYVLSFSQSLQAELGPQGLYIQVVLPTATRTEIWERSGRDVGSLRAVMEVGELVDAALVGFDRRELVTIPSLPSVDLWNAFEAARGVLRSGSGRGQAAGRYKQP